MRTEDRSFASGYPGLKTARQKKRSLKEDFDKQLIQLHRLQKGLYEQKAALPWIPLAEPYQKGWKRTFILREDVARSASADFYRALLEKINTVSYSPNRSFTRRRSRRRKKVLQVQPQYLREFYEWEWNHPKQNLTEEEKAHFHVEEQWSKDRKIKTRKYIFTEPWRFALQVRPYMITHKKMVDEVLEQQIVYLRNYIERNHLECRIDRLVYGRHYKWRRTEEKIKNQLKNKPLCKVLEAVYNDEL